MPNSEESKLHLYMLPGMGGDKRMYQYLQLNHCEVHHISWEDPKSAQSLGEYAQQIVSQIQTKNNVIVGSSMGGMMAVELSLICKPLLTIILSAPSCRSEFPKAINLVDSWDLQRFMPLFILRKFKFLANWALTIRGRKHQDLFHSMLDQTSNKLLRFSIRAVLKWDNEDLLDHLIQIVGDKDKLFSASKMEVPIILKGGGHFSSVEFPSEISDIINDATLRLKMKLNQEIGL